MLLAIACLIALASCESSNSESAEAQDRDGYAPQMGVVAGDINDYGE